jgi:anti-sigma regulatory factor (Ser/Thr protein kinase)
MPDDVCEDAALVVTELVANVVDHARTSCQVRVNADGHGLRIEVRDFHPCSPPHPGPVDPGAVRGRGLQVVAALSTRWGVIEFADGKCMWAVLALPLPGEPLRPA